MDWKIIQSESQLDAIIEQSKVKPCLIFKHSTTCPISSMAKRRLEMNWDIGEGEMDVFYLDLLSYRPVSNLIAQKFQIEHQSPQVLLIEDGICTFNTSHLDISAEEIKGKVAA